MIECIPLLELAFRRRLIAETAHESLRERLDEIGRMTAGLIRSVNSKKSLADDESR